MAKNPKKSSEPTSPEASQVSTTTNEALDTSLDRLIKIAGGLPSESPSMPGFAMADDLVELPDPDHPPLDQPDLPPPPADIQVTWDPQVAADPTTAVSPQDAHTISARQMPPQGHSIAEVTLAYDPSEVPPQAAARQADQLADDVSRLAQRVAKTKPLPTKGLAAKNPNPGLDGEILGPDLSTRAVRYEQRIQVLDAFQYPGHLSDAPDWVDRNWAAYGDWDPVRNIEAGPALRVPLENGYAALARPGDYVVFQQIKLDARRSDQRVEVWPKESFEKIFLRID